MYKIYEGKLVNIINKKDDNVELQGFVLNVNDKFLELVDLEMNIINVLISSILHIEVMNLDTSKKIKLESLFERYKKLSNKRESIKEKMLPDCERGMSYILCHNEVCVDTLDVEFFKELFKYTTFISMDEFKNNESLRCIYEEYMGSVKAESDKISINKDILMNLNRCRRDIFLLTRIGDYRFMPNKTSSDSYLTLSKVIVDDSMKKEQLTPIKENINIESYYELNKDEKTHCVSIPIEKMLNLDLSEYDIKFIKGEIKLTKKVTTIDEEFKVEVLTEHHNKEHNVKAYFEIENGIKKHIIKADKCYLFSFECFHSFKTNIKAIYDYINR